MEIIWMIFILLIGVYFIFFRKYYKIEKNNYLIQKRNILRIYSSFLSDIFVDRNDNKIDAENIENIWNNIIYFLKRIEKIQKVFIFIENNKLKKENKFINIEKKWLLIFCIDFIEQLNNWQEFHKKELSNFKKELDLSHKNFDIKNFKSNLELHKKNIENQIIILNN